MSRKVFPVRFFEYLSERFNVFEMSLLSVFFGASAIFKWNPQSFFYGSFAFFLILLQLRLTDEFKDFEHDKKYYPKRPVPRGLVTLHELRTVLLFVVALEIIIFLIGNASIQLFLITGAYLFLIAKEFFVAKWLKVRFTLYIISHELSVLPLFAYISSFDPAFYINPFKVNLLNSVFLGLNLFSLEIARKFREKSEYVGRDTYTENYGLIGAKTLLGTLFVISVSISSYLYGINFLHIAAALILGISLLVIKSHKNIKWGIIISVFLLLIGTTIRKLY